jgi:cytochrome c oxidase subunit IV
MSASDTGHQEHPLSIYLWIWILLFVLSGFIVSIFMHMTWERIALISAILVPPLCLLVLIILMSIEGKYTHSQRATFFGLDEAPVVEHHGKKQH